MVELDDVEGQEDDEDHPPFAARTVIEQATSINSNTWGPCNRRSSQCCEEFRKVSQRLQFHRSGRTTDWTILSSLLQDLESTLARLVRIYRLHGI